MGTQPESRLQRRIRAVLETKYPDSVWFKYHGGPLTRAGVPDLIGVVEGRACMLEVKTDDGEVSAIQRRVQSRLRSAGAIVGVVRTSREAIRVIETAFGRGQCGYHESSAVALVKRCSRRAGHSGDHELYIP